MAKFFRQQRKKLVAAKKLRSYLRYALGEVLLVVIGILIAVSINNWNEERKQQQVLHNIFRVIQTDLQRDTTQLNNLTSYYEDNEKYFLDIMQDSLSREEHAACDNCPYLLLGFSRVTVSTRGYELLKRYQGATGPGQDTLLVKIDLIYSSSITALSSIEQFIEGEIQDNLEEWESEYAWVADLLQENITPDYIDYVVSSFDYKNKIA